MNTLALVEKIGKQRRNEISKFLSDLVDSGKNSFWDMFHLLVNFSSREKNINAKLVLESIAERVLVLPPTMFNLVTNK